MTNEPKPTKSKERKIFVILAIALVWIFGMPTLLTDLGLFKPLRALLFTIWFPVFIFFLIRGRKWLAEDIKQFNKD